MNPQQIEAVVRSWQQLRPQSDAVGRAFYERLFQIDPALNRLFRADDREAQARRLMSMLDAALTLLARSELQPLTDALQQLGRRHAGYGVQPAHYATVGQALLDTLAQGLGAAFTPALREAWTALYGLVSRTMIDAAAALSGPPEEQVERAAA
jgi:methyl-accepting chemotaxis protein